MKIKTVLINRNGSPLVINAGDFRYGSDELWSETAEKKPEQAEKKTEPERGAVKVTHKGGGRWTVEVNGHKAHDGLLSKKAAQALAGQY